MILQFYFAFCLFVCTLPVLYLYVCLKPKIRRVLLKFFDIWQDRNRSLKSEPQCRFPCLLRRRADVADKPEKKRRRCFFFFYFAEHLDVSYYWAAQMCFYCTQPLLSSFSFCLPSWCLLLLSSSDALNDCFQEQQGVLSLGQECEDWPVQRVSNSFLCKYFNAKNKVNILTHKSFSINICPSLKLSNLEQPTISKSMTFYFFCSAPWKRRMWRKSILRLPVVRYRGCDNCLKAVLQIKCKSKSTLLNSQGDLCPVQLRVPAR